VRDDQAAAPDRPDRGPEPKGRARSPAAAAGAASAMPGAPMLRWILVVATLLHVVATPPFQVADEDFHFYKAYQVSLGGIVSVAREGGLGYPLPEAVAALAQRRFPPQRTPSEPVVFDAGEVLAALRDSAAPGPSVFVSFPNMAPYAPSMYAPQALGILLVREAGLPPLAMFYAGRLVNGLAGVGLILLAVALMPFGRRALLAVALLPMVPSLLGSLSADATIIGLGFVGIALAMRASSGLALGRGEARLTPVAGALLALAKGVYLPILAAGIPDARLRLGARQWLLLAAMIVGAGCFLAWVALGRGAEIQYSIVSRRTLEQAVTARPGEQLGVILAAPLGYAGVLASSFLERLPVYALQAIGRFGWNTILMPLPLYALAVLMLALAVVTVRRDEPLPRAWQRAWWILLAAGLAALVETALYLTGTPLGADHIQGTQGRYFLPFLPLLLLALRVPALPPRARVAAERAFPLLGLGLNLAALFVILDAYWVSGVVRARGF